MTSHSHRFVDNYEGLVGFGADRRTDENSLIYYLQKFSDDELMGVLTRRMSDEELKEVFGLISRLLKTHLSDGEYHRLFLKEDHRL